MTTKQKAFSFDLITRNKIVRGCLIAGGGAVCVYLLSVIPDINIGIWTPAVTAIASIVINAIYEYIKGQK